MNSENLVEQYRFEGWLDVGDYILRRSNSVAGELPHEVVVFALRVTCRSDAPESVLGAAVDSNIAFVGFSTQLHTDVVGFTTSDTTTN